MSGGGGGDGGGRADDSWALGDPETLESRNYPTLLYF